MGGGAVEDSGGGGLKAWVTWQPKLQTGQVSV